MQAIGPLLRVAVILRHADWHEDGTYTLRCVWCGCVVWREVQIDHLIPREEGGTDARDNLVPSCPPCNVYDPERYVPRWLWKEAERPITKQLRAVAHSLACHWYPWYQGRAQKNREKQCARDAARRERVTRKHVRALRVKRAHSRREDNAYKGARSAGRRAA